MGRVVVVADRGYRGELEGLSPVTAEGEDIVDAVVSQVRDDRGVVLVADGAWRLLGRLAGLLERESLNPFVVRPLDPLVEPRLAGVSLRELVVAKLSGLARSAALEAPYASEPGKIVDRRSLLRLGPAAALVYRNAPVLVSRDACHRLDSCNYCTTACPHGALEGKPPRLELSRCRTCSLCVDSCPVTAIDLVSPSIVEAAEFLRLMYRGAVGYAVLVCTDHASVVSGLAGLDASAPVVFIPVHGPIESIGSRLLLLARSHGFEPVILCGGGDGYWADYVRATGSRPIVVGDAEGLRRVLSRSPRVEEPKGYRNTIVAGFSVDEASLDNPLAGIVEVDEDKCTLCGGCVNVCPTDALAIEAGEGAESLVFRHDACLACGLCEAKCPEKAISVRRGFRRSLVGKKTVLARAEQARCLLCGKPIGPLSLVVSVERQLVAQGLPEHTIASVWLCNECKVKTSLGLVDSKRVVEEYRRRRGRATSKGL